MPRTRHRARLSRPRRGLVTMATIAKDPSPSLHTALKSLLMLRFFWRFPRRHGAWPKYEYLKPWIAGLEPKAVVDVGVNKGQFLHLAHRLFPDAAIIGTELVVELCAKARRIYRDDSGLTLHDCAYGDEDGKSEFFITRDSQNCSTHRPTEDFYAARPGNALIETSRVTVNRLDRILEAVPGPLFVKIDAQGGELEVLEGLGKRLADVAALIIESPFEKAYGGGAASFADIYDFLTRNGLDYAGAMGQLDSPATGHVRQEGSVYLRRALK